MRGNSDVARILITWNWKLLEICTETLKKNKELVKYAMDKSEGFALQYADKDVQRDDEFVKRAIEQGYGKAFFKVSEDSKLKDDRAIVEKVLETVGRVGVWGGREIGSLQLSTIFVGVFQRLGETLRNDRKFCQDILWDAVKKTKAVFFCEALSKPIRFNFGYNDYKELVAKTLEHFPSAADYTFEWASMASHHVIVDVEAIKKNLKKSKITLTIVDAEKRKVKFPSDLDRRAAIESLKEDGVHFVPDNDDGEIFTVSSGLGNDCQVVESVVKIEGAALKHAGEAVKRNKKIVTMAIRNNANAFEYASDDFKATIPRELLISAMKSCTYHQTTFLEGLKNPFILHDSKYVKKIMGIWGDGLWSSNNHSGKKWYENKKREFSKEGSIWEQKLKATLEKGLLEQSRARGRKNRGQRIIMMLSGLSSANQNMIPIAQRWSWRFAWNILTLPR